ncbi:hypothetical protein MMC12_007488 [Toensbergia leucococca]|nr:hypothetical protein [Toensbergia leucococca]
MTYEPLKNIKNTRIIQLEPASGSQSLVCNLREISVTDSCETYDALSYTWGEFKSPKTITCDGHSVSITNHLHCALQHLRSPDAAITLWVDQLCIDQTNVEERGRQVQLMERIYRQAQRVVVWLGDEDGNSRLVWKLMRKLLHIDETSPAVVLARNNLESLGLPGWRSMEWKNLEKFLDRPWFKRIWVLQEVVVSTHAIVKCGQDSLLWEEMVRVIKRVKFAGLSTSGEASYAEHRLSCELVTQMDHVRNYQKQGQQRVNFFHLLMSCRNRAATDSRDKIFALLGLGYYDINPDYSKTETEVYLELATYHVSQIIPGGRWQRLSHPQKAEWLSDLLLCACNAPIQRLQGQLPSWVPDWKDGTQREPIVRFGKKCIISAYNAGGDSLGMVQICNDTQLHLSGKIVDTVAMAGTAQIKLPNRMFVTKHHGVISAWFAESNIIATYCPQPYPTGEPMNEVYKRTLVVNRAPEGGEASLQYVETQYGSLISFLRGQMACMDFAAFHERHSQLLQGLAEGRVLILTKRGYLGLAPWGTRIGDSVCVLLGMPTPTILRSEFDHFKLVGECYVHGIMKGEIMKDERIPVETVILR